MEAVAASREIQVLGLSVVLLLAQIIAQATAARDRGSEYLAGPRDEPRESRSVVARRLDRALRNFLETYPAFIALALGLAVTGKVGGIGAAGAMLWLAARVVYVFLYAAGVSLLRTLVWMVSLAGLLMMLVNLFV